MGESEEFRGRLDVEGEEVWQCMWRWQEVRQCVAVARSEAVHVSVARSGAVHMCHKKCRRCGKYVVNNYENARRFVEVCIGELKRISKLSSNSK